MTKFTIDIPFDLIGGGDCDITIHIYNSGVSIEHYKTAEALYLFIYIRQLADRLRHAGRLRTAETYLSALHSFKNYRNGEDIDMRLLTAELMADYQHHLLARGVEMNTVSFYMRILRTIYRRAVSEQHLPDQNPFALVYTGIGKTRKRALTWEEMEKVVAAEPSHAKARMARDLFLFSFYTRGMSTVDIFHLKQTDLASGVLSYHRQKTGQLLRMDWTPEMEAIRRRWPSKDDEHLLGLLDGSPQRADFRRLQSQLAYHLKRLGAELGLKRTLTMYVARHTWASMAKALGVKTSIISDAMGHNSEKTTRIYLSDLDANKIDQANRLVIDSLYRHGEEGSQMVPSEGNHVC